MGFQAKEVQVLCEATRKDIDVDLSVLVDRNGRASENYGTPRNSSSSILVVHLVESDSRLRAQLARRLLAAGFHTEIYAGTQEFASFAPKEGVILIDDANHETGLHGMVGSLMQVAPGMPIIVYCDKPTITGVVAAMKAHAVNYLSLDVADDILFGAINEAFAESDKKRSLHRRIAEYAELIRNLSARERQVLEMLVEGESNKGMARLLGLSPRTVEIHRMKMMGKLGAKTSAQAVKIWCIANITE